LKKHLTSHAHGNSKANRKPSPKHYSNDFAGRWSVDLRFVDARSSGEPIQSTKRLPDAAGKQVGQLP
jgi:hypothetical protein